MWLRNLFFVGVLLGGVLSVRAALFPPPVPPHAPRFDHRPFESDEFRSIVAQGYDAFEYRDGTFARHRLADRYVYDNLLFMPSTSRSRT